MYLVLTDEAIVLWKEKHFSLEMIAKVFGVSRMGVKKYLNKKGIDTSKGYRKFYIKCLNCGKEKEVNRKVYRTLGRSYCSKKCYYDHTRTPKSNIDAVGTRRGRRIVNAFFPLSGSMEVHHIDGDESNNLINNLMVFENHRDHMRYHRSRKYKPIPIWDGSAKFGQIPLKNIGAKNKKGLTS